MFLSAMRDTGKAAAAAYTEAIDADTMIKVLESGGGKSVVLDRFRPFAGRR